MDIGNLIRTQRKAEGKTLSEVGDAIAITAKDVCKLEKQNRGSMANLERICQFLGVEWVGLPPGSSLGARVRTARVRRGWTQEIVAKKAGISRPAVIRVENDRAYISTLGAVLDVVASPNIRPRKPIVRQYANLRDARLTPPNFIEQVVHVLGGIDLDPCSHPNSLVPATRQYFQEDDGLSREWKARTVFINPPYTMATKFMRKAHEEWLSGSAKRIVILVPARTHTKTFHEIAGDADIIFLKNYMRFWSEQQKPMPYVAPFSSIVLILGGDEALIERARATWGGVFVPKQSTPNRGY
jgi:transcriptional regulator with XRE-family HTH domain